MSSWLSQLRKKPYRTRRSFALITASSVTAAIMLVWAVHFSPFVADATDDSPGIFSTLLEPLRGITENTQDTIGYSWEETSEQLSSFFPPGGFTGTSSSDGTAPATSSQQRTETALTTSTASSTVSGTSTDAANATSASSSSTQKVE